MHKEKSEFSISFQLQHDGDQLDIDILIILAKRVLFEYV